MYTTKQCVYKRNRTGLQKTRPNENSELKKYRTWIVIRKWRSSGGAITPDATTPDETYHTSPICASIPCKYITIVLFVNIRNC